MGEPHLSTPEKFPVFFSGAAPFLLDGDPSGARGAEATVIITINNRPQLLTGIRITNVYAVDIFNFDPAEVEFDLTGYLDYLRMVDDYQSITTELAQTNIVVRKALQRNVIGGARGAGGIHWHPLPVPFPWRGGNNITFTVRRKVDYPDTPNPEGNIPITPTCEISLEGCMFVDDLTPPSGPPSTGMPDV